MDGTKPLVKDRFGTGRTSAADPERASEFSPQTSHAERGRSASQLQKTSGRHVPSEGYSAGTECDPKPGSKAG